MSRKIFNPFLFLTILYFCLKLFNLNILPIFNDEAIYLDWGWREIHSPGMLFYSLYDSKQPLLMWMFGISESIFNDQLWAGRFTSVIFGFFTLYGVYILSKRYFNISTSYIASLLYITIPIFSFYDRQALMEAAISAVGIWSIIYLLELYSSQKTKNAIILGLILGFGFLIKTSVLIFFASAIILTIIYRLLYKDKKILRLLSINFIAVFFINIILFIQPLFWSSLSTNSRYSLTLAEVISFPINIWSKNLFGNIEMVMVYLSPPVLITGILGMWYVFKSKNNKLQKISLVWFFLCILFQTFTVRGTTTRYLVSFLPYLCIPSSYFLNILICKIKNFSKASKINSRIVGINWLSTIYLLSVPVFLFPIYLTYHQLTDPLHYFKIITSLTNYSNTEYIYGQTSGYGINNVVDYLNSQAEEQKIIVGFALNAGNPENSMIVAFHKNSNVKTIYFDSLLLGDSIKDIKCLGFPRPFYFIARGDQRVGLHNYLNEVKRIKHPYVKDYSIGIYSINNNCSGKTLVFNDDNF